MAGIAPFPTNRCRTGSHRCVPETKNPFGQYKSDQTFPKSICSRKHPTIIAIQTLTLTSDKAKREKKKGMRGGKVRRRKLDGIKSRDLTFFSSSKVQLLVNARKKEREREKKFALQQFREKIFIPLVVFSSREESKRAKPAAKKGDIDLPEFAVPKFFSPRCSFTQRRAYFCNIFRAHHRPFPDFAPRKPYFSFNFISNLESRDFNRGGTRINQPV